MYTKKLDAADYDTDKSKDYLRNYTNFFSHLIGKPIKLLELGILSGGSLLLWRDFFKKGIIVGLDKNPIEIEDTTGRIKVYQGLQQDKQLLDCIGNEIAPEGFDIIIDDASHLGALTRISFWHLFDNHLRSGGIYVIEDWGTGYWGSWPDGEKYKGPTHMSGMVGFIKELVDECGAGDITHSKGIPPHRISKFEKMQIFHGQVMIIKR